MSRVYIVQGVTERPDLERFIKDSLVPDKSPEEQDMYVKVNPQELINGPDTVLIESDEFTRGSGDSSSPYRLENQINGFFAGLKYAHLEESEKLKYQRELLENTASGLKAFREYEPIHSLFQEPFLIDFIKGFLKGTQYNGPQVMTEKDFERTKNNVRILFLDIDEDTIKQMGFPSDVTTIRADSPDEAIRILHESKFDIFINNYKPVDHKDRYHTGNSIFNAKRETQKPGIEYPSPGPHRENLLEYGHEIYRVAQRR